jgi:hypothetical protein
MQKRVNIRRRIIIASLICSVMLFIFTTPLVSGLISFVLPPASVENVRIRQTVEDIGLSWKGMGEQGNIKSYTITINGNRAEEISRDVDNYVTKVEEVFVDNSEQAQISIQSNDYISRQSSPITFDIKRITESSTLKTFEDVQGVGTNRTGTSETALIVAIGLSVVLSIFTAWIFLFKVRSTKEIILVTYVGFINFSYLFITLSLLYGSDLPVSRFFLSALISIGFYIFFYLLFLTVNILYNSLSYELPLEQAAKAAQFIFSLIAAYLLLIVVFSGDYRLLDKVIVISFFVGFYSLASITMLKNIKFKDAFLRTLSITMVIVFAIFVISIWPVNFIYGILAIAVIYYILLSISLENRHTLTKYTWVEYAVLLGLILSLFLLTSTWGINGTML